MDIFKASERLMGMDDAAWARHANPLSCYSRFSCLPLLVLAIWSRVWIGWWSLLPIALAILWTWLNPRLFGPPKSLDSWASQGVMGERVFLARHTTPLPDHHLRMAYGLTMVSAIGMVPLIYGLVVLDIWAVIAGLTLAVGAKAWFVDRMVWIYRDSQAIPSSHSV